MKKINYILTQLILFACIMSLCPTSAFAAGNTHTPDYYDSEVRALFKKGQWEKGKQLLDEGIKLYPDANHLNELFGRYYFHKQNYNDARFYLVRAVREDPGNVEAKQILVKVEETTGNYSDAICYVNELLEVNPYMRGLWRKKIQLYKKQGNDVEADRLLKRLRQIYPDDKQVQSQYAASIEENYRNKKKAGNADEALASLRELVNIVPDKPEYYMELGNYLLQQGRTDEALEVVGRGATMTKGNTELVIKKAGILAGQARYQEAIAFIKEAMRTNNSGRLNSFYSGLLADAADAARLNDPYTLYGQLYEKTKSNDALEYMLSTSLTRGYNEDALFYISEMKKRKGANTQLLYKEYTVYKRMGNTPKAYSLLTTLVSINPNDKELCDELALSRLQQATNLISDGFYADALPLLKQASSTAYDKDIKAAILNKLYMCNYELKRYDPALAILDSIKALNTEDITYIVKKADVLNKKGHTTASLALLDSAMTDTIMPEMREAYITAYEEISIPFIKKLIEQGATKKAFNESKRLLALNPSSHEGLLYIIGMSDRLKMYDDYYMYIKKARTIYPEDIDFIVKQAVAYNQADEHQRALELLRPTLEEYPANEQLVGAFSETSEFAALKLIKEHKSNAAIAVVDTALVFDDKNKALLMAKGLAYESLHQYDSAYYYQKQYEPSLLELKSFMRHLEGLQNRSYKNEIAFEYLQGRYGEEDVITSVASVSYIRKGPKNTYTGRINYAGRDGNTDISKSEDQETGGVGLQGQAIWEHHFNEKWATEFSAALANKYFPKLMANAKVTRNFKNDFSLDLHASYRLISTYKKAFRWNTGDEESPEDSGWAFNGWEDTRNSLISLGAGVSKTIDRVVLSGKADGYVMSSKIYFNTSAQMKYFPLDDGKTSITVMGGVGTAPEANMIDNAMPGSFDKINTMVGLGGMYLLNKYISAGIMGTWYTFYSQTNSRAGTQDKYTETIDTRYKNLYNVHFQLSIHF